MLIERRQIIYDISLLAASVYSHSPVMFLNKLYEQNYYY
jgi:hypothetical protein